jgi:hypothetical protein
MVEDVVLAPALFVPEVFLEDVGDMVDAEE